MVARRVKALTLRVGTGYGDAASLYVAGLAALGVSVDAEAVALDRPVFRQSPSADTLLALVPHHWWASALEQFAGLRHVVSTAWETSRLPGGWADALNRCDQVLVPSQFNRQLFLDSGVQAPIAVVPHGARSVQPIDGGEFGDISPDDFVFYTIGEWRTRKNMATLVRAYLDAFTADDAVALVIKTTAEDFEAFDALRHGVVEEPAPHYRESWWTLMHLLREYRRPAKVHLIVEPLSQRGIDQLHTRGDCFVSMTRGEGWGLGSFDAALFDRPSIITDWSGHRDYLGDAYPLGVRYALTEVTHRTPEGRVLSREPLQQWAEPDRVHASELMQWAVGHRQELRDIGRQLGARLRVDYNAEMVCRQLLPHL